MTSRSTLALDWLGCFSWLCCFGALSACANVTRNDDATMPNETVAVQPQAGDAADGSSPDAPATAEPPAPDASDIAMTTGTPADAGTEATPADGELDASAPRDATADTALDSGDSAAPNFGELTFSVVTRPTGHSRYEPHNVLTIWVENADDTPIKLLLRYTGIFDALPNFRERVLPALNDGSVPFFALGPTDPDTITSATYRDHDRREVRWNMTDHDGAPVPNGRYTIVVELADDRQGSNLTSLSFDKGETPLSIEVPESEQFGPLTLSYTPPQ